MSRSVAEGEREQNEEKEKKNWNETMIDDLFSGENHTKICGAAKIKCYNDAEDKLSEKSFIDGLTDDSYVTVKRGCNCLPSCTSITYDAEMSQAAFNWTALFTSYESPLDEFPG